MLKENDKYKMQLFQVGGLSCISPLGKIFLDLKDMSKSDINPAFLLHLLFSLLILRIGIILIMKGFKISKRVN